VAIKGRRAPLLGQHLALAAVGTALDPEVVGHPPELRTGRVEDAVSMAFLTQKPAKGGIINANSSSVETGSTQQTNAHHDFC